MTATLHSFFRVLCLARRRIFGAVIRSLMLLSAMLLTAGVGWFWMDFVEEVIRAKGMARWERTPSEAEREARLSEEWGEAIPGLMAIEGICLLAIVSLAYGLRSVWRNLVAHSRIVSPRKPNHPA